MKIRIRFLVIFYLFALTNKPSLTEDTENIAANLENKISTPNVEGDLTKESVVINNISNTFEGTGSKTTVKTRKHHEKGDQQNIVGGFNAQLGWYPYQVALYTEKWGGAQFYCGGSIISNYYVLTAAHCTVHKDKVKIVGGTVLVDKLGNTAQVRYSRYIIIHEKYDHESGDSVHDISLMIVDKPFYFNNYVKPVYLANRPPPVGRQCVVSGWGNINPQHTALQSNLKALFVKVIEPGVCRRMYEHFIEGMICSGFVKGQDFCFGDSGGPLVCDQVQHGVVSFFLSEAGDLCATGGPQVYTKVYFYKPWIDYYMNLRAYRKDDDSSSTKSKSNSIRPQLFVISAIIALNIFYVTFPSA